MQEYKWQNVKGLERKLEAYVILLLVAFSGEIHLFSGIEYSAFIRIS